MVSRAARIADDALLYVLDDEGVFFSEGRQELQTFNTAATFLWCGMEAGMPFDVLAAAFASAFSFHTDEARRVVSRTLRQWYGLGYVAEPALPAGEETDLTTALGWLLYNAELRRELETAPAQTAARLGLSPADAEALGHVGPGELEAQAALNREAQRALRDARGVGVLLDVLGGEDLVTAALRAHFSRAPERSRAHTYRLLDTRMRLRLPSEHEAATVHQCLAHLEVTDGGQCDVALEVLRVGAGYVLLEDLLPIAFCTGSDRVAPLVKAAVGRIATNRHRFLLQIHGGVVSASGQCLLLPAAPAAGKTTLVAALARSGFEYFSDEFAMLERGSLHVRPVPLSLTVKESGVDLLSPWYPELPDLPLHVRGDEQSVRYLNPPTPLPDPDVALPIRWLVFPTHERGSRTELISVSRPEALRRLMRECLILPELLDRDGVESLVRWMRGVDCYQLTTGPLPDAVARLRTLCGGDPADGG